MEMATAGGRTQGLSHASRTALRSRAFRRGLFPVAAAIALALVAAGCGNAENTLDPLLSRVNQARDAQALASLQQAIIAATLVKTETGGSYGTGPDDLAVRLQAKDPTKRFATSPSTGPDQIQVMGGGATPAVLIAQSNSKNYVAVWSDGNGTAYYRGVQPPALVVQHPAGNGWSDQPDVSRLGT
jgi:hypothetical protein